MYYNFLHIILCTERYLNFRKFTPKFWTTPFGLEILTVQSVLTLRQSIKDLCKKELLVYVLGRYIYIFLYNKWKSFRKKTLTCSLNEILESKSPGSILKVGKEYGLAPVHVVVALPHPAARWPRSLELSHAHGCHVHLRTFLIG